ncbi:hypothetical protein CLV57_2936 [Mucilaginibacter auburnensis]|uniref:Uncharacterized protein n=2 Tax=Mucilaginibacter auburnensis TaxID=1457233 RepID=A0A2H9VN87_9SPHI|nr:hypothetical protein CLV57_2936 [Mucilaginibacter auburnensis]
MSALCSYGQMRLLNSVNDKVKTLKQAGVDTIVTYHPYCVGCILIGISGPDTCFQNIRQYVIWKHKGEGYVQLFDECYKYQPQKGADGFIAILSKNAALIVKEKILPVEIEKKAKGKVEKFTILIDHSDHRDFIFYLNGKMVEKRIDLFELDSRWEDDNFWSKNQPSTPPPGKAVNINYAKNQKTYLKKLVDLAEQEIEKMKFEKAP